MAYSSLPPVDDLTVHESTELTFTIGRTIDVLPKNSALATNQPTNGSGIVGRSRLSLQQVLDSHKFIKRHNHRRLEKLHATFMFRILCWPSCSLGSVKHVVVIDGSVWTKRKHNRSCQISIQWIFSCIDRDIYECFAVSVDQRNTATLLPIIEQFILPDTTIYRDQ
ncbi:unnamed protein product [Adineta ricciae]|uniref:Transposase n=1 Tax=Adineta ricciae TaxID=249248 RepID=A0A816ACB6_ADIRI|nr:unnamed protein product [Adineta ricciae]